MIWPAKIKKIIDTEKKRRKIKVLAKFLLYLHSEEKH